MRQITIDIIRPFVWIFGVWSGFTGHIDWNILLLLALLELKITFKFNLK